MSHRCLDDCTPPTISHSGLDTTPTALAQCRDPFPSNCAKRSRTHIKRIKHIKRVRRARRARKSLTIHAYRPRSDRAALDEFYRKLYPLNEDAIMGCAIAHHQPHRSPGSTSRHMRSCRPHLSPDDAGLPVTHTQVTKALTIPAHWLHATAQHWMSFVENYSH